MRGIYYTPSQDREYGPGQDDYEYDSDRQRQVDEEQRRAEEEQSHQ